MKADRKRGVGFLKVFLAVVAAVIFVFVILPAGCSAVMVGCAGKVIVDEHERQTQSSPETDPKPIVPKKKH